MKTAANLLCIALAMTLAACAGGGLDNPPPETASGIRFERTTRFDGEVLKVDFTREDGGKERFNSIRDEWYSWYYVPQVPNHAGRRWTHSSRPPRRAPHSPTPW